MKSHNSGHCDPDLLVAEVESGSRTAKGYAGILMAIIAFSWSVFQLYIASDFPYLLTRVTGFDLVFNSQESRQIHLAFSLILALTAYPLFKTSPRDRVPFYDWGLVVLAVFSCFYLLWFKDSIAMRAGLPTDMDIVISVIGVFMLGLAVFRSLGLPLIIVASLFLFYVFFGHLDIMPEAIQWKGASIGKAMWHFWMQTEGVFGVALGVSTSMIFLFVLFGAFLEKAGAGQYFIKLSFALLGHFRGGPAKASVIASALSGLYSGSSIANVVTTGTFTIPLMKKTGFQPEKAGAIEVASSTNGQLTPPVMGAAAFLISEFAGVSYPELIKHAFLPAIISYMALIYIVHLEALKLDLKGLNQLPSRFTFLQKVANFLLGFLLMSVLVGLIYFVLSWVKVAFPTMTIYTVAAVFLAAYAVLVSVAAKRDDLHIDEPNAPIEILPRAWDVAVTGLYFLLPIVVLIWCILIERLSPSFSAYWAIMSIIFIVLTQHPLKRFFRRQRQEWSAFKQGISDFTEGMIAGARGMISIAVATAMAGIIVGTVSLTGAHQVVGEFVEFLSNGSLFAMLLLVALMSLILGMGLPTTANYIVVSSLMTPVIVTVGAQSGLLVPLVAVHLFVFYFGILADDTPPVGLAAFAAAAISGGDPIKTGIQGFAYDIRTALLPFLFIFNTELLLINVAFLQGVFVFIISLIAMLLFAAATQGFWLVRSKIWETILLLLASLTLFHPGFWLDRFQDKYIDHPGTQFESLVKDVPEGGDLRMVIAGPDFDDSDQVKQLSVLVPLDSAENISAQDRLKQGGLMLEKEGDMAVVLEPLAGTALFTQFNGFDFYADSPVYVKAIQTPADRIRKEIFYLPALIFVMLVFFSQRRRKRLV